MVDEDELIRCRDLMSNRGPDAAGAWIDSSRRLGLGHRRLAVLGPQPNGVQPMATQDNRFRIVFNGEIYNYREVRSELRAEGVEFFTCTDTEVLLAAWRHDGLQALRRLRGMFAFAIWDDLKRRLVLVRDPLGIKPLYYNVTDGTFRFASQVKALQGRHGAGSKLDPAGLAGFLLWGSVPEPFTILDGIRAVPAGSTLEVDSSGSITLQEYDYFRPSEPGLDDVSTPCQFLEDSVSDHLVSDVPVSVFLSAGLDSTLIAALAARQNNPVALTLRFEPLLGTPSDEGPLAAVTAKTLGLQYRERVISASEFDRTWEAAIAAMDQPSIDGFNTFLVSRLAKDEGLKVALSGLGGDEIFGSYPSFRQISVVYAIGRSLRPVPGKHALSRALARATGRPKLAGLAKWGTRMETAYFLQRALFLPEELPGLIGHETASEGLARLDLEGRLSKTLAEIPAHAEGRDYLAIHTLESCYYLRNQLLRDADWAGMAHSVEIRTPLVDAKLWASLIPLIARSSVSKREVVRACAPELPPDLLSLPKRGFYIPVTDLIGGGAKGGRMRDRNRGRESRRLALRILREWSAS